MNDQTTPANPGPVLRKERAKYLSAKHPSNPLSQVGMAFLPNRIPTFKSFALVAEHLS
jgi:hypothetical protein